MPYKVVTPDRTRGRKTSLPGDPPPPVTIREVPQGSGYPLQVAFRLAARLAGWPPGLVLEPVAHEVVGA
jgi:hypothetical protein